MEKLTDNETDSKKKNKSDLSARIIEIALSIFVHPVAVLLMWLHLIKRQDLSDGQKLLWAATGLLWGVGPVLYILLADGRLW